VIHNLKCWTEYYQMIEKGLKTFELRKNDRDFRVGDILRLHEWDNHAVLYTLDSLCVEVLHILFSDYEGGEIEGLQKGYVIMQIRLMSDFEVKEMVEKEGVSLHA
jgi:uncharacterized protein YqfB (UPF0267 family)